MIFLDESDIPTELLAEKHGKLANDMMSLVDTPGWKLIQHKLTASMGEAYSSMMNAKTGEESLKACTAYTILKNILDAPDVTIQHSLTRVRELDRAAAMSDPEPQHHRHGQGMTFPRPKK